MKANTGKVFFKHASERLALTTLYTLDAGQPKECQLPVVDDGDGLDQGGAGEVGQAEVGQQEAGHSHHPAVLLPGQGGQGGDGGTDEVQPFFLHITN